MTGGVYTLYADTFSGTQGDVGSGGVFDLFSSGESVAVGRLSQTPATGSITFTSAITGGFREKIVISDGLHNVIFYFHNWAGAFNALCVNGEGDPPPIGGTPPCDVISVDVGGGNSAPAAVATRLAAAIGSSNHNLGVIVASVDGATVNLQNVAVGGMLGNVDMIEMNDTGNAITLSGMSGGTEGGYFLHGGFQAMETGALSMSLDSTSVSLGQLSYDSVSAGSAIITITTDSGSGYTVSVTEDGNLRGAAGDIDDVSDGTVTAGSEEYGIQTSGSHGQLASDTAITANGSTVASYTATANSAQTTVLFHASIDRTRTLSGSYSHIATFTSTVNP